MNFKNLSFFTKKNHLVAGANIVLLVVALVFGYFIVSQQTGFSLFQKTNNQTISPDLFTPLPQNSEADSTDQEVLKWPAEDAPLEEKQRHSDLIKSLAQDSEYVDIADCKGKPLVTRVNRGNSLTLRNQDAATHVIRVDENNVFSVPAGGTKEIVVNFKQGLGNYGYVCDGKPGPAGILFVVE